LTIKQCRLLKVQHPPMGIYFRGNKGHSHSHVDCFPFLSIPIPNFVVNLHFHGIPMRFPFLLGIPFLWSSPIGWYISSWKTHLRATERHLPYGITKCYLPPDTAKRARLYSSQAGRYSIYLPQRDERLS